MQIDAITFLTDDEKAKAFLASNNQLQNMVPIAPYDHLCNIFATDTAYCAASHDVGHPDPADNGFTVLIIPKDAMPKEQASL